MSLPFALVRHGRDDVPVLLGTSSDGTLAGLDLVEGRFLSLDPGDVGTVFDTDPAAVFFGVQLAWASEREERAAAEGEPEAGELRKVDGRWALVSRSTDRPLVYYRGHGKPPPEWTRKQEQRVQFFKHQADEELDPNDAIVNWSKPVDLRALRAARFTQTAVRGGMGFTKPVGVWYACGDEWLQWMRTEMPQWRGKYTYKLDVDRSKMLVIRTPEEFLRFERQYLVNPDRWSGKGEINWPAVAEKYPGIEICPYQYEFRFKSDWYYSWDVASGCVWDTSVIRGVERIPESRLPPKHAEEAPVIPLRKALGKKFEPLLHEVPLTGFDAVRVQLLKHRAEIPSVETIRLTTLFAGMTVGVGIAQAEHGFKCLTDLFARSPGEPPIGKVRECIWSLGYHQIRERLYSEVPRWAPVVQEAMRVGMRDRVLREHLFLHTDLPAGISLAKLSFVLALLGNDVVCLDVRLLDKMFGPHMASRYSGTWDTRTRLSLARYERTEDAFLRGNPFYVPGALLGRARAQWRSWEAAGKPARTETHAVWLDVVR